MSRPRALDQIVVTAEKVRQPLLQVPVPVTALSTESLAASNQFTIQDYYTQVPGLSVTPGSIFGGSTINIRGIGAMGGQPTVGVTLDDVQFGPSGAPFLGGIVPEIDPEDLQQIEVLRGPQGTLYGANSMGGLIRYVTISPRTEAFSAHFTAGVGDISQASGVGYNFSGSVNMPITQNWAVRASAFMRTVPGYIDDPVDGAQGINSQKFEGGRLSSLWKISDGTSLKVDALLQEHTADGNGYVTSLSTSGQFFQSTAPNTGGFNKKLQIFDADLNYKVGAADLTSITAYSVIDDTYLFDYSYALSVLPNRLYPGFAGTREIEPVRTGRFTEELRLSVPLGSHVDWMLGFFYAHENNKPAQTTVFAIDTLTGKPPPGEGLVAFVSAPGTFRQYAGFTNLTLKITSKFDVQMGLRESRDELAGGTYRTGPLFGGNTTSYSATSEDNALTYSFTPRYRLTPSTMFYFRAASGFRPGGFNGLAVPLGLLPQYGPDKTKNYEAGVKADLLDHSFTFDASIYHIDWQDLQIMALAAIPGGGQSAYVTNAGAAKSQGLELTAQVKPWQGATVEGMFDYNDAVLTKAFPSGATPQAPAGERLPGSTRTSGDLSIDQVFPLGAIVMNMGGSVTYQGNLASTLVGVGSSERLFPSCVQLNLHLGASYESWQFNAFVNNVTDKRSVITDTSIGPTTYVYIQPRTIGLSVTKEF